jgi:acyl-CoA dehydrogenase
MNAPALSRVEDDSREIEEPRRAVAIARDLTDAFARRASVVDENDRFVAENYEALKQSGLVEAGVPRELGGGGADVARR